MALSASRIAADMFTRLTMDARAGFSSPMSAAQQDMIRAWCDAFAGAWVTEVTAFGQVTVTVTSVSGVTSGPSVSGPGTGTGTIS